MSSVCRVCGKPSGPAEILFTCTYCGKPFCAGHRLPPNHSCPSITKWRKLAPPPISTRTGIPLSPWQTKERRRSYKPVIAICLISILLFSYVQFPYLWEDPLASIQKWLRDLASTPSGPATTTTKTITTTSTTITETLTTTQTQTITTTDATQTQATTTTETFTTVAVPSYSHQELVEYALELINKDRAEYGLPPVKLGDNLAAQKHAEEMLENRYISHWNLAGLKPYMRYTLYGGMGAVSENVAFSGFFYYEPQAIRIDPKEAIANHEYGMMYDDEEWDWGHRDNILDKWHNKVNIGIAYDETTLAFVQDFEDDFIVWRNPINYENGILSLEGKTTLGEIYSISIYYDPPSKPLTKEQLLKPPYNGAYSWGKEAGYVLPSPYYLTESHYVHASKWQVSSSGEFEIAADIRPLLRYGEGVYTVIALAEVDGEFIYLTTYVIFTESIVPTNLTQLWILVPKERLLCKIAQSPHSLMFTSNYLTFDFNYDGTNFFRELSGKFANNFLSNLRNPAF